MDIKIKEELNGTLTQVKCEEAEDVHGETVFVSSHQSLADSEMCNKTEIKEEPCWPEEESSRIKQQLDLPSTADVDLKNEIKDLDTCEATGDLASVEVSRLHTFCRNSDTTSCFFTATNMEDNSLRNNNSNITETYVLISCNQPQMFTESVTACILNSDVKDTSCNTIHRCEVSGKNLRCLSLLKSYNVKHEGGETQEYKLLDEDKRNHKCQSCKNHFSETPKQHELISESNTFHRADICNKHFTHTSKLKVCKSIHKDKRPHKHERHKLGRIKESNLKEHNLISEGKNLHRCEICSKHFIQASHLKRHKLIHEGKRPHMCEVCKKSFTQGSDMKKHKLIHEGKKPHSCEICNKSFTQVSHLQKHKLIHEGKRSYLCEICNKSFIQASHLKKHKLIHEGKSLHTCEICKNSFTRALTLKHHKLMHQGKKLHKCETCKKSFTRASHVKRHKLIHEGQRRHSCEICFKDFTEASHLKEHKLTHEEL